LGRYRGLEKAYRKLQTEARKANITHGLGELCDSVPRTVDEGVQVGVEHFLPDQSSPSGPPGLSVTSGGQDRDNSTFPRPEPELRTVETVIQEDQEDVQGLVDPAQEPMSNPLALLAYASDAAQASETSPTSTNTLVSPESRPGPGCKKGETEGHRLLHRPGYVSLGLQLDRASLVLGLDTLLDSTDAGNLGLDYFKRTIVRQRDVGPDLDPVELGLVTMEDAHYYFPM
jgi:hypothetical protein